MRGLIVGYGRAGQRHAKTISDLGHTSIMVDPAYESCFPTIEQAIKTMAVDFAVIATPPDLHLLQIRQCLDAGLPVLCEKPLCGLGQLTEAEALLSHPYAGRVMIAYNYRFHPKLQAAKNKAPSLLLCEQQRELPAWGLLLDHCSHDLDILSDLCGPLTVKAAKHNNVGKAEGWTITTETTDGKPVIVWERVGPFISRVARLKYPGGQVIDIDPNPAMFAGMWAAFLRGDYTPGLREAIETQQLLERCKELNDEN